MKSKEEWLTSAASEAAAIASLKDRYPDFSLLISCVGRRLVLGNNSDKEVLAVGTAFHEKTLISGFYSYGEITPFNEGGKCQLHNQTMTITSFYEN
jgi:hypothetical protein